MSVQFSRQDHRELLQMRSTIAGLKTDLAFERFILALKYDEAQARAPAGTPIGGQWVRVLGTLARFIPHPGARLAATAGLAFYSALAGREDATHVPVLEFRAKEFGVGKEEAGTLALSSVRDVERDEVERFCPRFGEVQERTDRITAQVDAEGLNVSAQNRGTEIHTRLRDEIRELRDQNFIAEQSYMKERPANYGDKGSIRIDVLEHTRNGAVCVYDIKTGRSGLAEARMAEIAATVYKNFPQTNRILVSEVRPR